MEQRYLERVHHVMSNAVLPEAMKSSLEEALHDAAGRGFHIDFEQLQANLSRMGGEAAAC